MAYEFPGNPPIADGIRRAEDLYQWMRDVNAAVALSQRMIGLLHGLDSTGMGILAYGESAGASFALSETTPPSMRIYVAPGAGFIHFVPVFRDAGGLSAEMVAPEAADRIDTVVIEAETGAVLILEGSESETPEAPAVTVETYLKIGEVYHRPGEAAIFNADTSGEGYLVDNEQPFNV